MSEGGPEPADLPRLGTVFGRYRLDALIGRGGMGVVFRATDLSLERSVALKFLSPEHSSDPTFRERFIRESRLAAAIEHPGIVPIYEAGAIGDALYIAMRFVPGHDLGSILRLEAPLGRERTLALARQLADALDAAHRRGLVHRDVKPANVLIEQDTEERAFLADFGLTRRLGDLTAPTRGGPLGTIDYVAPEQVQGRSVDGRADQYALACVAYHCLTGVAPFGGDSDAAVLFAHLNAEPQAVSALDERLPTLMDDAIARALSKSPNDRFVDCRSFVAALAGDVPPVATGSVPNVSDGAHAPPPPRAPMRRRRVGGSLVVIGVAVVLAAGILVAAPGALEPEPAIPVPTMTATGPPQIASVLGVRPGEVIVFSSDVDGDHDLYSIAADGQRPSRLTDTPRNETAPAISPDGTTVAYSVGVEPRRDIWLMDSDGRRQRPLVTHPSDDADPAWSSDGKSLAFASRRSDPQYDIFEIRDRGAGLDERNARNRTARPAVEHGPDWAPGSRRVAIASNYYGGNRDILVIDFDDPDVAIRRTSTLAFDFGPAFAPTGGSLAFFRRGFCSSCPGDRGDADLYVIDPGRGERRLTSTAARDEKDPDWAPDSRALVYASGPTDSTDLWAMTPDGGRRRRLTEGWSATDPSWGRIPADPTVRSGSPVP